MDDAFKRLEELVSVPAKKKRVYKPLTPEQRARQADSQRKWRANNREEKLELDRKWRAENQGKVQQAQKKFYTNNHEKQLERMRKRYAENQKKYRESANNKKEREAADPELFAINQAERYARIGSATRDITDNCPEPTRSKLQALVDQIKQDPSAGKQVVGLLCNMRELRKLELAEQQHATETETEN